MCVQKEKLLIKEFQRKAKNGASQSLTAKGNINIAVILQFHNLGGRNGDQSCDKQWCPKEKRNQLNSVIIVSVPVAHTTMERPQGGAGAASVTVAPQGPGDTGAKQGHFHLHNYNNLIVWFSKNFCVTSPLSQPYLLENRNNDHNSEVKHNTDSSLK